jgi:uncharacterized protein (DUF1499 family)
MAAIKSVRTWSLVMLGIGLLLVAATAYAIAGSRNGLVGYREAFTYLRWIAQAGGLVLIVSMVMLALSLRYKEPGTKLYAGLAALIMGVLVGTMVLNEAAPPPGPLINDITTDLQDPPRFQAVIPLRPASSNPIEYGGAEIAANQRQVHPEVQPIQSELQPAIAFAQAHRVASELGWDIVSTDDATGIIEAVDTTPFFRFKDDVVIRVRPTSAGSRIDLRSHSREGISDLGKNAARIMEFREAFLAN